MGGYKVGGENQAQGEESGCKLSRGKYQNSHHLGNPASNKMKYA